MAWLSGLAVQSDDHTTVSSDMCYLKQQLNELVVN